MLFLRAWGRLDGAAAMAALKGDADLPPGDSFACAALAGWAAKDAAAAKAYIEAISDPQRKSELTYGLLDGWAAVDFDAAAAYAASLPAAANATVSANSCLPGPSPREASKERRNFSPAFLRMSTINSTGSAPLKM